jgi:hypothetical protein
VCHTARSSTKDAAGGWRLSGYARWSSG